MSGIWVVRQFEISQCLKPSALPPIIPTMPKGPQGQKRPADVIGNAVRIMRIATGDEEETPDLRNPAAVALSKLGASKGGVARAARLTAMRRKGIAKKAASARWVKSK